MTLKPLERPPRNAKAVPRHAAAPARRPLAGYAAALALIAVLILVRKYWAAQVLLVPLLLIVPGLILLRTLRIPGRAVSSFPVYVPCASIVVLLASGIAVNLIGPLVGIAAPLRVAPLLTGLEITCAALLAASVNAPSDTTIPWHSLSRSARHAWPLIVPLVAAAGALRLNSGHSDGVALIALSACVVLIGAAVIFWRRLDKTLLLEIILYSVGLAILWSFALRSDLVNGFDIATEYYDLHQAVLTGIWHTAHPGDAYGAMLSITVLPAELHALSGIPSLLIFKVVYPAIYALFPVAIFGLARRILSTPWAFAAAAFAIGQYAFAEIAGFARQEIALVLFVAVIAAILDTWIRRFPQWCLVVLLGLAMVVSHYSTTYVAITVVGLALPLQWVTSWFREIPRVTGAVAILFATVLVGAAVWYGPVTNSAASSLQHVVEIVAAQGPQVLPNRVPGESFLASFLYGNTKTPIQAARYANLIHTFYLQNKPYVTPFPQAILPQYALRSSSVPVPPVRLHLVSSALGAGQIVVVELANLVCAVGALLMVLRRKATSVLVRGLGLLALAAVLLLAMLRFSGTLAVEYGQERAQIQGLALLSISLCWILQSLASRGKRWHALILGAATACLAVLVFTTSYLSNALLGGNTSDNLASDGPAFEYYYMTAPELASAQWLGRSVGRRQLIYADEYGELPLAAMTGMTPASGLLTDVTPRTLSQLAWVYASRTNIVDGRAFALYQRNLATYVFPSGFLRAYYNVVYTDGSSEVFHR